jgi:hypothetical protein
MRRFAFFATVGVGALGAAALVFAPRTEARQGAPAPMKGIPMPFAFPSKPPKGALVLLSKDPKSLSENWTKRYSKDAPPGMLDKTGVYTPGKSDITSKAEFGDHFLHVEFRCPEKGGGNAGIGLLGRYEVQIYNTFEKALEKTNGAALYSQTQATYNASKKPGEWQSYDIFFRAPRFDAEGKVRENARASVFWNGVLVHNNAEFKGPTGIQYAELRTEAPTGPVILQGDHDVVQYRNIWVVAL